MESKTLVKIHVSHKETGLPAVGYSIDLIELDNSNGEKISDASGDIEPFYMDLNNFIYADVFVSDPDGNMIVKADGQFPLVSPETIIHVEV